MRNPTPMAGAPSASHASTPFRHDLETRYYSGLWGTLRSPGAAVAITLMGYYSFAGFANAFAGESSIGGVLIRILMFATVFAAYAGLTDRRRRFGPLVLLPASLFFLAYLARLLENLYFSQIRVPGGAELILSVFIVSGILTSYLMARIVQTIRVFDFTLVATVLIVLFLIGMFLNREILTETANHRLMLERMNPISMSHLAASFLIFHYIFFKQSKTLLIMAIATTPAMLLIMVYARSRGPILGLIASVLIYTLLLKGTRKIWALVGLAVTALGLLWLADGGEYLRIVTNMFMRTDIEADESTKIHYQGAVGAWDQFMEDLFFGRYVIEIITGFYPHNLFLEVPMAVGLFGAIPFAIHMMLAARATVGIIRATDLSLVATFVALTFIRDVIAAFLAGSVWASSEFWVGSFLVIAFWHGRDSKLQTLRAAR
jgi:hypothetical protein